MGLVVGAFGIATQQALEAWRRYETSPVVITIEKDFFNWDVENPSILICLRDKPASSYKIMEDFMKYGTSEYFCHCLGGFQRVQNHRRNKRVG
jgi:hypothetical protein